VCRAKDSYASLASAWRLVQVQQQYAVTLSLPLTLPAADLAAAQAQASTLTTGSNATNLIASAVAAGLISGRLHLHCEHYMPCVFCLPPMRADQNRRHCQLLLQLQ